jgi:hypothetical protein
MQNAAPEGFAARHREQSIADPSGAEKGEY